MGDVTLNYMKEPVRRKERRKPSLPRAIVSFIWWTFMGALALGAVCILLYFTIPMALAIIPLAAILLITSFAEAARAARRQRSMRILTYIDQAVRLNLPLPTMLASAELSERGRPRRRLVALRELLQLGLPISEALRIAVPEVSDRAIGLIRAAESTGTLPLTIDRLLSENRRDDPQDSVNVAFYRSYPLALALIVLLVMSIFLIFVMPKYQTIFRDFGIPLPTVTQVVLNFGETILFPLALIVDVAALVVVGRAVERFFRVRPETAGALRGLTDRIAWFVPIVGRATRDRGLADVFDTLGDATKSQLPLDGALADAAHLDPNLVLARRLRRWRDGLQSGNSSADAARAAGMPKLAVGLLAVTRGGDDAPAVFQFLGRYYRSRFSRTWVLLTGAFVPAIVLCMGAAVCAIALAMYLPMIRLIDMLTIQFV